MSERKEFVTVSLTKFPATVRDLAKIRAIEERKTLKQYIEDLILADVARVKKERRG